MVELREKRRGRGRSVVLSLLVLLSVVLPIGGYAPVGPPAPGLESAAAQSYPGWMTSEQAALFTSDWPALVPSYVPEPFGSVMPSISIDGGSYRIYWYVGGGAPTFLDVRGYSSGYIPAGSAYDLNVELTVNSAVRGNEAYHDPTPIYDAVYWREGGISYWANSQGLPADIVSYANSFTYASVPAPEPTATIVAPATLYSPDAIVSGGTGTVTTTGGGEGATLTADGGYFPDTGTATYPAAGDAAVSWVAPDVPIDTTITFSLLDANGAVLATTPTLVTAAEAPVAFALACAPTVEVGEALPVSVTGSGSVMLDASVGSWPRTSPNTDYDPGTDGATLAFSLGGSGGATLTWVAPASAQTATIQAFGPSGMVVGSCQVEVVGETATAGPTAPAATSTVPATVPGGEAATLAPTTTAGAEQAAATLTPTVPGTNPGDGTDPADGSQPTVLGTGPGDGIDPDGGTSATATIRSGDGTDLGRAATVPAGATYPAIPTGAPLPDAPPTSVPPGGGAPTAAGQAPQATAAPTRSAPIAASTVPSATVTAPTAAATRSPAVDTPAPPAATGVVVPPLSTSVPASDTPEPTSTSPPIPATATATPTERATAVPSTATIVPPTATTIPPTATTAAPTGTAIATRPTATTLPASPIPTSAPPAATDVAPADQAIIPPTAAVLPPTATPTSLPATATPTTIPPTATATSVPPTATSVPPTLTATPAPPTATTAPPTATTTRRPPATATATPVRSDQGNRVAGALLASPTTTFVPTIGPTAPPASPTLSIPAATPTVPQAAETVTQEIGPDGGTVRHPAGAELQIGPGVFESTMIVSMAQVPDTELPVSPDIDLVPSSGYDIEITGADGRAVTTLPAGVVLRLALPQNVRDDAVVYWIDDGELTQLGVTNQEDAGISAPLAHLSRYVAGVPLDEKPELGWLPWAMAIAAAISGLLVVGLLANRSRRQRRRGPRAERAG